MTSARLTPAATTSMSTWPGRTSGSGTSSRTRLSASPGSGIVMARMGLSLLTCGLRAHGGRRRGRRVRGDVPHVPGADDPTARPESRALVYRHRARLQPGRHDGDRARGVAPLGGVHLDGPRDEADALHHGHGVEVLVAVLRADRDTVEAPAADDRVGAGDRGARGEPGIRHTLGDAGADAGVGAREGRVVVRRRAAADEEPADAVAPGRGA